MRIGLVTPSYPASFTGGIGQATYQTARALAGIGHEVHVFTTHRPPETDVPGPPGTRLHHIEPPSIRKRRGAGEGPWDEVSARTDRAAAIADALTDHAHSHPLDIVEFPEREAAGLALLLDPKWHVPTVTACHVSTALLRETNDLPPIAGCSLEWLQTALADGVCAASGVLAKQVSERIRLSGPVAAVHAPCWADEVAPEFTEPEGQWVLYAGELEKRRGVTDLVFAAGAVLQKFPEAHFALAGRDTFTGPDGRSMKEHLLASISGDRRSNFVFLDNVPGYRMFDSYRYARCCVFPARFEDFPQSCLEAMAAGRPVVATRSTGTAEIVGDAGVLVPPKDPHALAAAIASLLDDPDRCTNLGERAFARVREKFHPDAAAHRRAAFYRSVIERSNGFVDLETRLGRVRPGLWAQVLSDVSPAFFSRRDAVPAVEEPDEEPHGTEDESDVEPVAEGGPNGFRAGS